MRPSPPCSIALGQAHREGTHLDPEPGLRASRNDHGIAVYQEGEREARGEMTLEEVARALGVSKMTVHRLIQRKQLPARQACAGAPWIIRRVDVDAIKPQAGIGPGPLTAHPNQLSIHFQ